MQHAGLTPCPTHPSHEAASVGLWQSCADDDTALVEEQNKQQAIMASHLKPKRVDGARSFVEQFGVGREEYEKDILCGHRSSDNRPMIRVGGFGKYTTADAMDYAAGRPYARKRGLSKRLNHLDKTAPTTVPGVHLSDTPGFVQP